MMNLDNDQLIDAYCYDAEGYYDGNTMWQVVDGHKIPAPSSTDVCPWNDGVMDQSVFYRFDGELWVTEKKPTCAADMIGIVVPHTTMSAHDIEMRQLVQRFSEEDGYRQVRGDDLSWSLEKIPEKTPEEIKAEELAKAKAERSKAVSEIVVEVDGMLFDGDEKSQQRMSIAIETMSDNETVLWVLADDSAKDVTKAQLQRALRLAREEQTALWAVPYSQTLK